MVSGCVLVQLLLTLALALILSALTVHFRDLKDILGERDDAVVFRHADHLLLEERAPTGSGRFST